MGTTPRPDKPKSKLLVETFAFVFMVGISLGLTLLATALARILPFLHWPLVALLAITVAFALWVITSILRDAARRQDTATSSIRGAAQGEVELRGRAHHIPGCELVSELMQTPCIAYNGELIGRNKDSVDRTLFKAKGRRSFILRDGTGEVFVPGSFFEFMASNRSSDLRTAPPLHMAGQYSGFETYLVNESAIPLDKDIQINGVFATLDADATFLPVLNARSDLRSTDAIEEEWRVYADAAIAAAGPNAPPPRLNVILPRGSTDGLEITSIEEDSSNQFGVIALITATATPPLIALLDQLGAIDARELYQRGLATVISLLGG